MKKRERKKTELCKKDWYSVVVAEAGEEKGWLRRSLAKSKLGIDWANLAGVAFRDVRHWESLAQH